MPRAWYFNSNMLKTPKKGHSRMRIIKIAYKIMSSVFALSIIISSFSACKKEPSDETNQYGDALDISGFTIVRADGVDPDIAIKVKNQILEKLECELSVKIDTDTPETDKEILIGNTNRAASSSSLAKIKEKTDNDAYIIDITDTKIVIVGTSDKATERAVKVFLYDYVNASVDKNLLSVSKGNTSASIYDRNKITELSNGAELEIVVSPTTVLSAYGKTDALGHTTFVERVHYPSIIELQYQQNEADNGKLIAHFAISEQQTTSNACFMISDNGGESWSPLAQPEAQKSIDLSPGSMAHIYELPEQLGDFPAGTLVYASGSINYSIRSEIWIWYSTDCGKTWTQTSKIAEGGVVNPVGKWPAQSGVWEPFSYYDNGYLYCFYSDDSDLEHDQKIVYKCTSDGIHWSDTVDVCTFDGFEPRPGMFVMTKLGNGEYFMVYEYINNPYKKNASVIYYKKTSDITNWNPSDPGTRIATPTGFGLESAPSCIWVPTGGDCGAIIVSSRTTMTDLFISFDYGETWTTFANPLPWSTKGIEDMYGKPGYSAGFWLGSDQRTVYYINTTDIPGKGRCHIQFTSFRIY